jgi:hypothetical protein
VKQKREKFSSKKSFLLSLEIDPEREKYAEELHYVLPTKRNNKRC